MAGFVKNFAKMCGPLLGLLISDVLFAAAAGAQIRPAETRPIETFKATPPKRDSRLIQRPLGNLTPIPNTSTGSCEPCPGGGGLGSFDSANCHIADKPPGSLGLLDAEKGFGYLVHNGNSTCPPGLVNREFKYTLADQSLNNIQTGGYNACVYTPPSWRQTFYYNDKLYLRALCRDEWQCYRDTAQIGVHKKYPDVEWKRTDNKKKWAHNIKSGFDFWYHKTRYVAEYPDLTPVWGHEDMREQFCPNDASGSYNLTVDVEGNRDFCVLKRTADPQVMSPCTGSTDVELRHEAKTCYYPYRAAQTTDIGRPKGLWNPLHNTNNWKLIISSGTDYYQHKKNSNRRIETTCAIGLVPDSAIKKRTNWIGQKDWCVRTDDPQQNATTASMTCSPGYVLEQR